MEQNMEQSGYLLIVNNTSFKLNLIHVHSNQMNAWNFSDVDANSTKTVYVEFNESFTDNAGDVVFQIGSTNAKFNVHASRPFAAAAACTLVWKWIKKGQDFTITPPDGNLDWTPGATVTLTISH